jgi:hypothetical protein
MLYAPILGVVDCLPGFNLVIYREEVKLPDQVFRQVGSNGGQFTDRSGALEQMSRSADVLHDNLDISVEVALLENGTLDLQLQALFVGSALAVVPIRPETTDDNGDELNGFVGDIEPEGNDGMGRILEPGRL